MHTVLLVTLCLHVGGGCAIAVAPLKMSDLPPFPDEIVVGTLATGDV